MSLSNKKRKKENEDEDGFQQASPSPMLGETPRRVRKIAQRPSIGGMLNSDFIRLKQTLYRKGVQEIMESEAFRDLFSSNGPRLPATPNGHPQFVMESLTDLRWQLAALKDLYQRPTGDVISMGQDDTGQLGLTRLIGRDKLNGLPPTVVQDMRGKGVIQVACGGQHTAALTQNGSVYTWGSNDQGALARVCPANEEKYTTPPTPVVRLIPSKEAVSKHAVRSPQNECNDVVAIDVGESHTLFLTISGNVYMGGSYRDPGTGVSCCDMRPPDDTEGKDNNAKTKGSVLAVRVEPVHVYQLPKRAKMIASGDSFNAVILEDGDLWTWGFGLMGELARTKNVSGMKDAEGDPYLGENFFSNGDKVYYEDVFKEHFLTPKPVCWEVSGRKIVTHVSCGGQHLLVAARAPEDSSSRLYVAGANGNGRLGLGDEKPRHELVLVEKMKDVPISRVAAGAEHSLVLNTKGDTIFAAGNGGCGQLGILESKLEHEGSRGVGRTKYFTRVAFPATEKLDRIGRFVDIFCGDTHSGAITSGGKVYTWGFGEYGQCGNDPSLNDKDIKQPRLNEDWLKVADLAVYQGSGGSQHGAVVATRYKKTT